MVLVSRSVTLEAYGRWRLVLVSKSVTLVVKMYTARYYLRCNFLDSNLEHNPSFVWRSIYKSKFTLKAGSRWSVGDGKSIPILSNNWIFGGHHIIPHHESMFSLAELKVADRMIHEYKSWNVPFISSIFIMKLPPM